MLTKDFTYESESRTAYCCAEKLMGTRFEILLTDIGKRAAELLVDSLLEHISADDSLLNRFDPSSEVSRLNSAIAASKRDLAFSEQMTKWCELAELYRAKTGGIFDVRYGGGYDFGGLAKGEELEWASETLRDRGIHNALLNFGGSSIVGLGHHPYGDSWTVDVPDPFSGRTLCTVRLCDSALSVSGNTPGYGGQIVDTQSGERVLSPRVVVVTALNPADAEVLSTALMAAQCGRREKLLAEFPGAEAQFFDNL